MNIRDAGEGDVKQMSAVFVASITGLCAADHGGDPAVIARWTANKDEASLMLWLGNRENHVVVAERDDGIVGIGSFNGDEIQADYVAPRARFAGVSKALLAHMEARMRDEGVREARLTSTETAHRMYLSAGWRDCGAPQSLFGVAKVHPMCKTLA